MKGLRQLAQAFHLAHRSNFAKADFSRANPSRKKELADQAHYAVEGEKKIPQEP
jgi:hypothetical protein